MKTGRAAAVALAAGPRLVGKWDVQLAPEDQERFVYHAAQGLGRDAAAWVRDSERVITRQSHAAFRALLDDLQAEDAVVEAAAVIGDSLEYPGSLADIVKSHNRLHTAEGVLYRRAVVDALHDLGVDCELVPAKLLPAADAVTVLGKVPPPWRKEQKDAARAALSLARSGAHGSSPRTASGARRRRPG